MKKKMMVYELGTALTPNGVLISYNPHNGMWRESLSGLAYRGAVKL